MFKGNTFRAAIEAAAEHLDSAIPDSITTRLNEHIARFDEAKEFVTHSDLVVFTFHSSIVSSSPLYKGPTGVTLNHEEFDLERELGHFVRAGSAIIPSCSVIFATSENSTISIEAPNLCTVKLPITTDWPMFERALAMTAFVHSQSFSKRTVLLDTDAIINNPLDSVFANDFDVGLTFRRQRNVMPINEGAIFLSHRNHKGVRAFFKRYLSTYTGLTADQEFLATYGSQIFNIPGWLGGQLSLNALLIGDEEKLREWPSTFTSGETLITLLPCDVFNFTPEAKVYSDETLATKVIIHMKGNMKGHIDNIRKMQIRTKKIPR